MVSHSLKEMYSGESEDLTDKDNYLDVRELHWDAEERQQNMNEKVR